MKKLLSCALALCLAVSAFSLDSGLFQATASTVRDDASYFMDAMDWQKLDFKKFYGFTSIDSATSGNLATAFKLKNGDTLMASWEGNLWTDPQDTNSFAVMYGKDKYAFGAGYAWGSFSKSFSGVLSYTERVKIFSATFGMNVTDKDAFSVAYALTSFKDDSFENLNIIDATYKRAFNKDSYLTVSYEGIFWNDFTLTTITPAYHYEYKAKKFTYGLNASVPFMFVSITDVDTSNMLISPVVQNGISVALSDALTLNTGIKTTLPYIYKLDDDTTTGTFANDFTFGLSLNAGENVRIDAVTDINLASGISIDDVKALDFMLTATLKL